MSHYVVIVRLHQSSVDELGLEDALSAIMRPYYEQGEPSDDFMEFQDCTEEVEGEWNDLHKEQSTGTDSRATIDKYSSLERYATEYHGYHEYDGRYGYWSNPNAKWDWYQIGGRWTGYFPLKQGQIGITGRPGLMTPPAEQGTSDVVNISDIDMDKVSVESREKFDCFSDAWFAYASDPTNAGGDVWVDEVCPRATGLDLGLVIIRTGPPEPGEENRARRWGDIHKRLAADDNRRDWHDIIADVSRDDLEELADHFCTIRPYAYLDSEGWCEPGKMGWFGCDRAEPDTRKQHAKSFLQWLKETPDDCLLVAVDCHI